MQRVLRKIIGVCAGFLCIFVIGVMAYVCVSKLPDDTGSIIAFLFAAYVYGMCGALILAAMFFIRLSFQE